MEANAPSDLTLLDRHRPEYHFDRREKHMPVDLRAYVRDGSTVHSKRVSGIVTRDTSSIRLHYFTFYVEDGGLPFLCGSLGAHRYDVEHLIVELDSGGRVVVGVVYMPHGSREHFWIRNAYDLDTILVDRRTRPTVFVSRGKHAQYPIRGAVMRYFGLLNDTCDPAPKELYFVDAADAALAATTIGGVYRGLRARTSMDLTKIPTIRLRDVRKNMFIVSLHRDRVP
jgi:hypothetical protein